MNDLKDSELARLDEIRRVGTERCAEMSRTLAAAFAEDPFTVWFFGGHPPESEEAEEWWSFLLNYSPEGSEFHVSGDLSGVAVWHPPGRSAAEAETSKEFRKLIERLMGERAPRILNVFGAISSRKPDRDHWHLAVLGVVPGRRNVGMGARLVAPMLARCDRKGVPAYLESSNPRNVGFYERQGFGSAGKLIYDKDSPPLTLMWRDPQTAEPGTAEPGTAE